MYKKEVRIGKYLYTYYYYNIKIRGKVKNICLGRDKQKALQKIKDIDKKRDKIRNIWNDDFYKKLTLSILIMSSMLFFITGSSEVIAATPGLTLYYPHPPENTGNTTSRHTDFTLGAIGITAITSTLAFKTISHPKTSNAARNIEETIEDGKRLLDEDLYTAEMTHIRIKPMHKRAIKETKIRRLLAR